LWIFWLVLVTMFDDWFCNLHYFALLLLCDFCAWLRMANFITVSILKCITGWFFTITQEVVVANTLFALILACVFSMMPKGGRLIWPCCFTQSKGIVDVLKLSCLSDFINYWFLNQGQYGQLVCHHQKGEFVEFIFIGCRVLMITNLIDKPK